MADSGLDLFDPTCPFYNDLCTHYPDILGKDIPLEKRILAYYPDIELCEDNCDLAFVFLNNKTAKCECPISGEGGKLDKLKENSLYKNELGYFEELKFNFSKFLLLLFVKDSKLLMLLSAIKIFSNRNILLSVMEDLLY